MGYTGSKYNPRLSSSEVAKLVKQEIQAKYPEAELSVSKKKWHSGGWSLNVEIKDCGFNPYEEGYEGWRSWYSKHPDSKSFINKKAQALIDSCDSIIADYNYNHSEVSSDYFDIGFYSRVELVEWSNFLLYLKESKMADFYKRNNPEYVNWAIKRISAKKNVSIAVNNDNKSDLKNHEFLVIHDIRKNVINVSFSQTPAKTKKSIEWLAAKGFEKGSYEPIWFIKYNPTLLEEVLKYFNLRRAQNWKLNLLWFEEQLKKI